MAQLWGGRFTKETDQLVYNFNASITFDKRFYKQDIKGSLAHVAMLAKQGILTEEEKEQITDGLNGILEDVESGKLEISDKYEHNSCKYNRNRRQWQTTSGSHLPDCLHRIDGRSDHGRQRWKWRRR